PAGRSRRRARRRYFRSMPHADCGVLLVHAMESCLEYRPDRFASEGLSAAVRGADPPDPVADIVGDQQGSSLIHSHTNRAAERVALPVDKSRQYVDRLAGRATLGKRHEHDLIAAPWPAVP